MTAPVFVVPPVDLAQAVPGDRVLVSGAEGRHAVAAMRLIAGEAVDVVDGAGRRVRGRVDEIVDRQAMRVAIDDVEDEHEPQPRLVLVQALPKGDRGELAVELATEIGIDVIVPWAAAACVTHWKGERLQRGHRKWVDASIAAGKQSRRARFPVIESLASTADVVRRVGESSCALVLDETASSPIGDVEVPLGGEVLLIVGPEGGVTDAERSAFVEAGARVVRLGPSVLRTSSAGIAAAAALLVRSPRWSAPRIHPA